MAKRNTMSVLEKIWGLGIWSEKNPPFMRTNPVAAVFIVLGVFIVSPVVANYFFGLDGAFFAFSAALCFCFWLGSFYQEYGGSRLP